MTRQTLSTLLLLLGAGSRAGAETLSLPEAMQRARDQASEVAAAAARERAAASRLTQARAYRLPAVRLEEMWNRTDSPAESFAFQLNQERFSFADFVASDPNDPDALTTAMTRLEVSMPVYTGGELPGRVEQARLAAEAAEKSHARTADAAAFAAAEAYVQLAQARETAALLATSRDTVARHVATARAYVEQGMLVRSELLRAEVELARVDDFLAEAQGGARLAEAMLSFRLGADLGESWELQPLPAEVLPPGAVETWVAEAGSRADLAAAREMVEAGKLEESVRRAAALPRVGVVLRHDRFDDFPFGVNGGSSAVMAVAGIDLWNGGRHRAAAEAARAEAEAGERDVERMERGIRLAVKQAWERLSTALLRMTTAGRALAAAREAERIVEERFRAGVVKTLDLLDAATARRETETREVVAKADAHLAAFALVFEAGRAPEAALVGESRGGTP